MLKPAGRAGLHGTPPAYAPCQHATPRAVTHHYELQMSIQIVSPTDRATEGPRRVSDNRRTRHHLRELCDEVLASYRAAKSHELFADDERIVARAILARIVPLVHN